jgi:rhomboid protease GluP
MRRRSLFPATIALIGIILIAFTLETLLPIPLTAMFANAAAEVWRGEVWRLVTAMFLHAGLLHLTVNVFSLFMLGRLYEQMFGTRRFLVIYFVSGLAASLASVVWSTGLPSVGASGAIFGVLGAFIFSIRRSPLWRNHPVGRSLVAQAIFNMILNIILTWTVPQIDKAGHVGGLVCGLLLGAILPPLVGPPPPPRSTVIDVTPSAAPGEDPAGRTGSR